MKTFPFLMLFLGIVGLAGYAESSRKTTGDMYMESYTAQLRRQTGRSAAEVRAEEYRILYEICDEHHDCINTTVKPFLNVPVLQ